MAKLIAALIVGLGIGAGVVLLVPNLAGEGESVSPAPPQSTGIDRRIGPHSTETGNRGLLCTTSTDVSRR